jgi:hypothetical protein
MTKKTIKTPCKIIGVSKDNFSILVEAVNDKHGVVLAPDYNLITPLLQ